MFHYYLAWGHWPRKGVWGWLCNPEDPFKRLSHSSQGSHFKQRSLTVIFHKTPFERQFEILPSTASDFAHVFGSQAPKFETFNSPDPSFKGKSQFPSPTLRKSGPTPLPGKSWAPPPRFSSRLSYQSIILYHVIYLIITVLSNTGTFHQLGLKVSFYRQN